MNAGTDKVKIEDMADFLEWVGQNHAKNISDLAKRADISRMALYNIFRSSTDPKFGTVIKICSALGIELFAVPPPQSGEAPEAPQE